MPLFKECPTCSKPFARKGDLTRHQLIHSGIKPYVCEICGKGFTQSSGLKTHLNTHSKAKPYKCGIGCCNKAFGDPSSCSRHRKETHTRERGFECDECGTRIKRRSAFLAHLRKHGLDLKSSALDAVISEKCEGGIPAPALPTSPDSDAENRSCDTMQSRGASPSGPGYYTLRNDGEAGHFTETDGWSDYPFDHRQAHWSGNNPMLLSQALDQTVAIGPPGLPYGTYTFPCGFDGSFHSNRTLSELVNSPLLGISSSDSHPLFESFMEAGNYQYQSSYTSSLNDELGLSLANGAPEEQLMFNLL